MYFYNYWGEKEKTDEYKRGCYSDTHVWVDTGLIKSYCRLCDVEGEWCRQACKYVVKGTAKWNVSEPIDNKQDK